MISTILIIDDSKDDQRLYQRAFKDFVDSYSLVMASSAQDGLVRIAEARPDLILIDYNLPDMDGLSLMKKLAEYSDTPIPIVMLTGEGSTAVAVEAMKRGAEDYLVKDTEGRYLRLLPGVVRRVLVAHAQREQTLRLQQKTEALLRRNQVLMQNSMDGIHVMDMRGNLVEVNDAFCRMLGYTREEIFLLNVVDWDAQMSPAELRERFRELVGKSARFETAHRRKDGTLINVEVSSSGIEIEERYFMFAASRDITGRKRAEEELKLSAQLLNSTSDSVFLIDLDGSFIYLNEAAWKSRGYTRDELMAINVSELTTPKFSKLVAHRIKELLENGRVTFESEHCCKDGSIMSVEVSSRVIESGGRKLILSSCRDISERKRAEGVLKLNKTIIENAYDGFWMYDTNGYLLDVNQAYADMIGYTREELIGMHISRLSVQSNTPELVKARIEKAVANCSGHFETQHRHQDGHIVDFDASIAYIPEANCLFSFIRDVTERKKNEAMLMQHKVVIDTSIDGFWVTDMMGNVLEVNAAYAKISGYTVEELVNMHISQLEAIEQKPEDVHAHIAKVVAQGYDRFETRHRHKDGHEIDIEISCTYMAEPPRLFVFCRDITERTSRDKAVNQARMELQDLYDQAPCGYHSLDSDGRIVKINKTEADWLGYERAELIGRKIQEFQTPSSLLTFAKNYPVFKEMGYIENVEYELVRKDGSTFFILLSATMVKDADGNFIMSRSSMIDITKRKRAEAALLQGEANLRAMLDNSPYMTWSKDTKGRYIAINKIFADYLRLEDASQAIGKTDLDLQPKKLAEKYRADDAEVMAARQRRTVEESAFDGKNTHWVETFKTPIIDKQGNVLGTVGFARDITERKKAEEKLLLESEAEHKRAEALEQQFGHLLQSSFNEIYLFDAESLRFLQVSEGAKKNLGYSDVEMQQLTPLDLQPLFTRKKFGKLISPLISGEQQTLLFETVNRRKDGSTYPVEVCLQLITPEPSVFVAVVQDITERRHAESQLREFAAHLQTVREEEKASVAREIHDDLGGTLTALKMDAHWLAHNLETNKEMMPLLERVESMLVLLDTAVQAVRRIISDLRPAILDDFGLMAAIKWQCTQFQKRTGIECRTTCMDDEDNECENELDKTQSINLFRIVQEALTNVARHSGASKVKVKMNRGDKEIMLSICDNGRGLPEGHTVAPTSHGVRGMCERVKQLDGKIKFDSPNGGGFCVEVSLPLLAGDKN